MRDTTISFATLKSDSVLELPFPYQGGVLAALIVRRMNGRDEVLLVLTRGQFSCYAYSGGKISAKFDAGPIKEFACSRPGDGPATILFIEPALPFITALKASSRLIIEAPFFEAGTRQMLFQTTGLKWQ